MAHTAITPTDQDRYYEGNSLGIRVKVTDEFDDSAVDLTGATATFDLKEDATDETALLTRQSTQGETEDEVEFTEPTNGELTVHIAKGDLESGGTGGVLTDGSSRHDEKEFVCFLDIEDTDGNLVTVEEFSWVIHAR